MKKYEIEFCGGESRYYSKIANFLYGTIYDEREDEDVELYAEVLIPDDVDFESDYGYDELRAEIVKQAAEHGVSENDLDFRYDEVHKRLHEDDGIEKTGNVEVEFDAKSEGCNSEVYTMTARADGWYFYAESEPFYEHDEFPDEDYESLKAEIIRQAKEHGVNPARLHF